MKKLFPALLCLSIILMGCQPSTLDTPKASDIQPVEKLAATAVALPAGTTAPTISSETQLLDFLATLPIDGDALITDIMGSLSETPAKSILLPKSLLLPRSVSGSLQDQLTAIQQSWENFPASKNFSATVSLSGEQLGQYITLSTGTAKVNLSAVSTDSNPLDLDSMTNVSSFAGSASLGIALDSHDIPSGSCIKGIKVRFNFGADASLSYITYDAERVPDRLSLDAAESLSIAAAVVSGTEGAIIVISADSTLKGAVDHLYVDEDPATLENDFDARVNVVLSVYDAGKNPIFTKTYSSIDELLNALGSVK